MPTRKRKRKAFLCCIPPTQHQRKYRWFCMPIDKCLTHRAYEKPSSVVALNSPEFNFLLTSPIETLRVAITAAPQA